MKRSLVLFLVLCVCLVSVFAEESTGNMWTSIGEWFNQTTKIVSGWASQAWDDTTAWFEQAWDDSSRWVVQAWDDSSNWVLNTWDNFLVWMNNIALGDPYEWIDDVVLDNGIIAFDEYVAVRSFLKSQPDINQIHQTYNDMFSKMSLLNEDKVIIWDILQKWSDEKGLSIKQTSKIALPFLTRLLIEGESVIGENIEFTGSIVAQYLLTILESLDLKSADKAERYLKILYSTLEGLTRPSIIGDTDQNALVTDDHYYIENFTLEEGKYEIIFIASMKDEISQYPLLRGKTLKETAKQYFKNAVMGETSILETGSEANAECVSFTCVLSESELTGKAVAIWAEENNYLFFIVTDSEWQDEEFDSWFHSISLSGKLSISFDVDMESDGSFYGINQAAQKYTINRVFDEEKFSRPMVGHGWAAERGNNLIDNLKGIFKRSHSTVIGDNNAKNGADRVTTYADGSRLLIQTKYYSTASRSIAACFDETGFRYFDNVEGKPMAIEVPADQYEAALGYMKNRIANGEIPGVNDVEKASEIVKKGSLTYQQAKHIAKAGTVESILYDSVHSCVVAGTAMGISAAVSFAVNLWNGESVETAINESILQGLKTGATAFIISVLSSQLAKTGLNTALIPASKVVVRALGPKVSAVIVNAFRPAGSAIYGAAAMQSAAKLLRSNAITSAVTFVVLSSVDVAELIRGRISYKQLAKNLSSTSAGIIGGTLGYIGGAALGTAVFPGAGTAVGIVVGVAAGWGASKGADAIADLIAEDDADEMIRIIEMQFSEIATEYFLNEEEVNQAVDNLQKLVTADMLKQMYQYRDYNAFARQLIEMAIDPIVAERAFIELPTEDEYASYLTNVLEAIYVDLNTVVVTR